MNDLQLLKERLKIPDLWSKLNLPGEPGRICRSPFREDRNPSFSIYDGDARWADHGTGDGGDAIDFLAVATGVSAADAVRNFVELAGGATYSGPAPEFQTSRKKVSETEEKRLARESWQKIAFESPDARTAGAKSRNLSEEAFECGEIIQTIGYATIFGFPCWVLTDASGLSAEARRTDGQEFPAIGNLSQRKAHTLKGSIKSWPVGAAVLERLPQVTKIMLVEGGPDYVAAMHFAAQHIREHGGIADTLPVAMLGRGTGTTIHPDALTILSGKFVRIYPHNDPDGGGVARSKIWAAQLHGAGCRVDFVDFSGMTRTDGKPVNDLNDLAFLPAEQQFQLANLLPV